MLNQPDLAEGHDMADTPDLLDRMELITVIIGASAVGKSTAAEFLQNAGIIQATPTWATRKPRPGEQDTCYDHRFVTDEEFDEHEQAGGFVDVKSLYGARYGVPYLRTPPPGKEALIVLKPHFMPVFLEQYPHARVQAIEASKSLLRQRMRGRGQTEADIEERLRLHDAEAATSRHFADVVHVNDGPIDATPKAIAAQIRADRAAHDTEFTKQT